MVEGIGVHCFVQYFSELDDVRHKKDSVNPALSQFVTKQILIGGKQCCDGDMGDVIL